MTIGNQINLDPYIVILTTLFAIISIRDILVKFIFPLNIINPKWKLLYNLLKPAYEIEILKLALKDLGYPGIEVEKIINDKKNKSLESFDTYEQHLVALIANYIYQLSGEKEYGSKSKTTKYYIHTMEMVHDRNNLTILSRIMYDLIITYKKEKHIGATDFVLVPKGGNLLLARRIAEEFKADLLVLKGADEESKLKISIDDDPETYFRINFEGGNVLLKKQKKTSENKLNGIVVDCNASGGSQVYNAIEQINKVIEAKVINAEYVNVAFVLFRVDDGEDEFTANKKYTLKRYFDLNEELKKELFGYSASKKALVYKGKKNINIIDNFIIKLHKEKNKPKQEADYD